MQKPQESTASLLAARDAARLLGIDTSTVYRMASDGRLPAIKVGRQWRFPRSTLHLALDRGVPHVGAPAASAAAPAWPEASLVHDVVGLAAEALGVMMVATDMEGRPLIPIVNPCPALAGRVSDAALLESCSIEWRGLAADLEFEPSFTGSHLGFQCARALVRSGPHLIGMVLAGGVAAPGVAPAAGADAGLYTLTDAERQRVLRVLPRVASTLSRLAGHEARTHAADPTAAGGGTR